MARTLATAAALLLAACPALALSSHSPRDLEAHPAFAVVLSEHYVLNETISELLAEPLGTPPHSSPPKRHLLRSPNGQAFLCTVPAVADEAKRRADVEEEQDALVRAQDVEKGVQNGLALLEPMRGGCLYSKQGWFTYSFCYGNEIRQFHEVRVAGAVGPSEDPNAESYTLGVSPEPAALSATPKYGSGSPELHMKEAQIPSRLGGGDAVGWEEGGRYLIQTFESGTRCDLTGLPRTVEVQYHCSTQSLDRIALVRETSICRYVMIVHTPRLCNEPLFLEGQLKHQEPAATIECQPVVRKLPAQLPQGKVGESASPVEEAAPPATEQLHAHVAGERYTAEAPPSPEPASPPSPDTHRLGDSSAAASAEHEHLSNDPLDGEAMLTLVYDPETGEIESAVTELGEDLFVDSALSRQLFGEHGEAEREQQIVDGQQRVGGQVEAAEVTVDTLAELAKLMHETLAEALRGHAGAAGAEGGAAPPIEQPQQQQQPRLVFADVEGAAQGADAVSALLRAINRAAAQTAGEGSAAEGGARQAEGLQKYLEGFQKEKKTIAVPRAAVIGSEAHEKLKQGIQRRYEDVEEQPSATAPRDEL